MRIARCKCHFSCHTCHPCHVCPPATHAPLPCTAPHPPPCTPPARHPPPHMPRHAMHAPLLCMPPSMHTVPPHMPPATHPLPPCMPPPPVNRILDTRLWKHYLAATSLGAVISSKYFTGSIHTHIAKIWQRAGPRQESATLPPNINKTTRWNRIRTGGFQVSSSLIGSSTALMTLLSLVSRFFLLLPLLPLSLLAATRDSWALFTNSSVTSSPDKR